MNIFNKLVVSVYRYCSRGNQRYTPYMSTIVFILIFLMVVFATCLCFILENRHSLDFILTRNRLSKYLYMFALLAPVYYILTLIFPHKKLKKLDEELSEYDYDICKVVNCSLLILSVVVFMIVAKYTYRG